MDAMILARSSTGRPTLQHKLTEPYADETVCGLDVTGWSRAYMTKIIPEIVCRKCKKKAESDA